MTPPFIRGAHRVALAAIGLLLASCSQSGPQGGSPGGDLPAALPTTSAEVSAPPTGIPTDEKVLGSLDTGEKMYALIEENPRIAQELVDSIVASGDERFIPVFIELLRATQLGIVRGADFTAIAAGLEALSGQAFGADWPAWVEWYGATNITPPPGFTGWKGQVLARIDPGFADFLWDGAPGSIRVEEIVWGGVSVDGIPALDNPRLIPADAATYLEPGEPVFGIQINGDARAYPLRIMDWHEMVNDVVGGVPVSLAYCTLCGAGIAYDGRAPDGRVYTFGSSGFLFRSNKLMYDRQTRTLWNQLTGEPVLGGLAANTGDEPLRLRLLPVVLTAWQDWLVQHPDTQVLDLETGFNRLYELGSAYGDYFSSSQTMFPVWERSDLLADKDRIYALTINGVPKAYPLEVLVKERVVNDSLAGTALVLIAGRGTVEVEGVSLREGPVEYQAGGEVRAYLRGDEVFSPGPQMEIVRDAAGRPWEVTEEALLGPEGVRAERVNGHLAYWFGWFSFFPQTELYGQP